MICNQCGKECARLYREKCRACYDKARTMASRKRNNSRTVKRECRIINFVGIDGEGVNTPDGHKYVMLSVGDNTLWKEGNELGFDEILSWILRDANHRIDPCYVGFFLGYDFTHWLKHLPQERARILFEPERRKRKVGKGLPPFPVRWGGWEFDILGMRRFKFRRKGEFETSEWVTICDVGSFFQTSFVRVIDPKNWPEDSPVCTLEEFEDIKRGKESRADVQTDNSYYEEMRRYNALENEILARVMGRLNDAFMSVGVRLNRNQFFGPGQVCQQYLNKYTTVPTHDELKELVPEGALKAAQYAYMGGWFERTIVGHTNQTIHEYDIASAYPDAMTRLPCLLHGKWSESHDGDLTVGMYTVSGNSGYLGAMNQRNADGTICRPSKTTGYYWQHEIDAARRAGLINTVACGDAWSYRADCNCGSPLAALADMYAERKKLSKTSARGKALKLILNSMYGKLAQSVGSPKYSNPVYASLITSMTRTKILDAIADHPDGAASVVMIATDGIYLTSRHNYLDMSGELGSWEHKEKKNLTIFKPGSYWDDEGRKSVAAIKSRGIPALALYAGIHELDQQFDGMYPPQEDSDREFAWPEMDIHIPFTIVSPRLALARGKWETCGLVQPLSRTESSRPWPKRSDRAVTVNGVTRVGVRWDGGVSYPYRPDFGIEYDSDDVITADGNLTTEITEFVHNLRGD